MQVHSLFFMFVVLGEAYQVLNDPLHPLKKKKWSIDRDGKILHI